MHMRWVQVRLLFKVITVSEEHLGRGRVWLMDAKYTQEVQTP